MKNKLFKILSIFSLLATFGFSGLSNAAVKITFIDGEKFSDYQLTGETRKRSLKTLEKKRGALFETVSSKYLTSGQQLEVKVSNVDLAGNLEYMLGPNNQDMRVIRDGSFIRLYFSYQLKDTAGNVIAQGEYKLKEFSDDHRPTRSFKHTRGMVGHFEAPLKKWFKATFTDK